MRRIAHFDEMMPHCNKHISVIMMEENHENDGKHTKVKKHDVHARRIHES